MSKRVARYALLTALAMALSWLESLVPLSMAAPGMKLGLTNIVVVFALYRMSLRDAAALSLVRVLWCPLPSATPTALPTPWRGRR